MSDYIQDFKSKIDPHAVRTVFPEITDSETPIWQGSPSFFSMADKYILAIIIFLTHAVFFAAEQFDSPEGDGQMYFILSLFRSLIDISGTMGFVLTMLIIAKLNHYANFSTSGKWTTSWIIISALIPFIWYLADIFSTLSGLVGSNFENPLPQWNYFWFLPLGIFSSLVMILLTFIYQNAFHYAITDKRIHIRKNFLFFDTSVHGISFEKIENLKANPPIIGRILGYGNVHILTASGLGIQQESVDTGLGVPEEIVTNKGKKTSLSLFGWISKQRRRNSVAQEPSDCLYGIRSPMKIYRLINELMDANNNLPGNNSDLI
ncbi:MAG: PH domain-containing protein [Candidatus Poseidoniales archaeon]|nr:MAG: PH domain-containing protein [Candidatus Poseidoniales archaeon]